MLNYAIPDDGAQPNPDEISALVDAFLERGLTPRLEYAQGASPHLETILIDAGFTRKARLPIMACRPGHQRHAPTPEGLEVFRAETAGDHAAAMAVADEAYGEPATPPTPQQVERRLEADATGQAVALAQFIAGATPAGSGLVTSPRAGVCELAAIGTATAFRHRGIAAAVTARLLRHAFDGGAQLIWLTPEHEQGERIYRRVGFERTGGHMLHMVRSVGFNG
jgi:GNAT superfamily N-acetyltransferase